MAKGPRRPRKRPLNLPLTEPTEPGQTSFLTLNQQLHAAEVWVHDRTLTRDEVRADELQMFVSRLEEDFLVIASLHFPFVRGRARQFKFTLPIVHQLRTAAGVTTVSDGAVVEQAIVDLEQLCKNFVSVALPALGRCALMLARSNPNPAPPIPEDGKAPKSEDDGREEFIVRRDQGWPARRPRYKHRDVVRLEPSEATTGVDSGYLIPAKAVDDGTRLVEPEDREALRTYRSRRAADALAARYRPSPTDTEAFMTSSEGAKVQQQIVKEFKEVADRLFPRSPGRKLALTPTEKQALLAELRKDLARRIAAHVTAGESTSKEAVYEEMAAEGQYGNPPRSYGAATIKNWIGRNQKRGERKARPKRAASRK
jgi:hypothetical protein